MGTGPEVMDKGKWMLETGVGSEFLKETDFETDIWSLNTSVIRYGLTHTTEVFAQTGFVLSDVGGEVTSGFAPVVIGAMMRVCEEQGIVPLTTFSAWAILPVGIESIRPNEVAPAFHALFGHTLSSRWGCLMISVWNGTANPRNLFHSSRWLAPMNCLREPASHWKTTTSSAGISRQTSTLTWVSNGSSAGRCSLAPWERWA